MRSNTITQAQDMRENTYFINKSGCFFLSPLPPSGQLEGRTAASCSHSWDLHIKFTVVTLLYIEYIHFCPATYRLYVYNPNLLGTKLTISKCSKIFLRMVLVQLQQNSNTCIAVPFPNIWPRKYFCLLLLASTVERDFEDGDNPQRLGKCTPCP